MTETMIAILMSLLASIALASGNQMSQSYDPSDTTHKLDTSSWQAQLWKSVKVEQHWGKWTEPNLNLKVDCAWFETESLCSSHGGGFCEWNGQLCVNKIAFTHVDDFCYSTPAGYKLNALQCSWLPYWRTEAARPSSKAIGKCRQVGEEIKCYEDDKCEAGNEDQVSKSFTSKIHTFDCQKDCQGIADPGIREELTHRCCAKCLEIETRNARTSNVIIDCKGCEAYSHKTLQTAHLVNCTWQNPNARVREICEHEGRCKTGMAVETTREHSMKCKIVPCDPMCQHDRQMYAACCKTCLENICLQDEAGSFLNYGETKVNQMCRGCIPWTATTTTTTTTAACTPFCCDRFVSDIQAREDESNQWTDGSNIWWIIALAVSLGFLFGLCIAASCFCLLKGPKNTYKSVEQTQTFTPSAQESEEEEDLE